MDPIGTPRLSHLRPNLVSTQMSNLPSAWFPVHPTIYGPPNQSGSIGVNRIISTNHVETH